MNVEISSDIIQLIQQTSTSESDDINDKIRAICSDLIEATNIGQSIYQMYENLVNEKKESDERNRQYGVIAANTLNELDQLQGKSNQNGANNAFDIEAIKNNSGKALFSFQKLMEQFANDVYGKMDANEMQIEKVSSFVQDAKSQMDDLLSTLSQISKTLSCSPQEIENRAIALLDENENYRQMLEIIIQNISGQDSNFHSIDSLLSQLGFKNTNIQFHLMHFFESTQQINEISEILHTNQKNIKNEINKLVLISNEASKPKLPPPPPVQVIDTSALENEILKLRQENEILNDTRQQLINEKNNLIERVAILQSQLSPHANSLRLTYERFDYLASVSPDPMALSKLNNLDYPTMSQNEIDEALASKNDTISQLNSQLQNALSSMKEIQENCSTEINSLKDRITNLQIEKAKKESQCTLQQKEINELRVHVDSLPQSELVRSLSSFFGGCANEEEILNKVYDMKSEMLKLKTKNSEFEMKSSNANKKNQKTEGIENEIENKKRISELKNQLDQATEEVESLQDQVSSLQKDNNRLLGDNNSLYKQIQELRDNEESMKAEISSNQKKVRESSRASERLQAEYELMSTQLKEFKGKYELYENESEKILTSMNKLATKLASASQNRKRQRKGNQNGVSDEFLKMCDALQVVFMQYAMSDFSGSEKKSNDLISCIEQMQNCSNQNQSENILTNKAMHDIIQANVNTLEEKTIGKFAKVYEEIESVQKKVVDTTEKFNELAQIVDDKLVDLSDYINNDFAPLYTGLKREYSELQEKYEALANGMGMQQNSQQFGQFEHQQMNDGNMPHHHHIQSRFQTSTPPRNPSRGSRSSIQSPSEIVLDRTIQENYNRSRLYQ